MPKMQRHNAHECWTGIRSIFHEKEDEENWICIAYDVRVVRVKRQRDRSLSSGSQSLSVRVSVRKSLDLRVRDPD
jgi:hypothetical protein